MRPRIKDISKFLGQRHPVVALTYVVSFVLIYALGSYFIVAEILSAQLDVKAFMVAGIVTLLVAAPVIAMAQDLMIKMYSSRLMLKALVNEVVVARDDALRANSFKSQFMANLSHELRTPLNSIIGFSQLLAKQTYGPLGDARYLGFIEDINLGGQHLLDLVNDILALAKLESGIAVADDHAEADVGDVVSDVLHLMLPLAERQGVSLGTTGAEADCRLVISERMLRQIVLNILSNAIKFTEAGGIVRLSVEHDANGDLAIRIHDTGVGMSTEDITVALTPFGQVARRNPDHSQEQGTGLGLPMVKAMMELQQGAMHIDSLPGEGTIVSLVFPAGRVLREGAPRRVNTH